MDDNAKIRIFADNRYMLDQWKICGKRPCRFDPEHPEYDIIDVGKYLVQR